MLVEQTIDLTHPVTPQFVDGFVVVTDPLTFEVESIDLATGDRVPVSLATPPDIVFEPAYVWPDGNDFLAVSLDGQFARWTNGLMVDHVFVPGETDAFSNGRDFSDDRLVMGAGLGQPGSNVPLEWYYVNTTAGELEVLATVADSAVVAPIAADGGFRLFRDDGILRSYDPTGALTGEIDTGLQRPPFPRSARMVWASSEDDRLVALGNDTGVIIVDTTTGTTTTVPTFGETQSLLFARGDSLLMVGSDDGTVRAWDVEDNVSRGVLWRGPSEVTFFTWYDDRTDSVWIAEELRLLKLPLNPDVYLQRACEVVNRDLTQDEWDQYVPGGGPVQSACT